MTMTYWDRHVQFTIPPAILLTLLYRPFFTPRDFYRILFLITIAVAYTIPWDAYLIRHRIWTYPAEVVWGKTLFGIPYEEVFFFVIQTYITSLLYLFTSKLSFKPVLLQGGIRRDGANQKRRFGKLVILALIAYGAYNVYTWGEGTYLGLILAWAGPVCLFLWLMSSDMLLQLPWATTVLPVMLPTVYLWIVDTFALRRGTWSIETGTKFGIHLWEGLEIEEAVFFLVTNLIIVMGLVCFDHTIAILEAFPSLFPHVPECPGLALAARALSASTTEYDQKRITGIQEAVQTLKNKSRSFYLASSVFNGRLRIDLTLLYAFCRVADDLVDNASSDAEAADWINKLQKYLDTAYTPVHKPSSNGSINTKTPPNQLKFGNPSTVDPEKTQQQTEIQQHITANFPPKAQSALQLLPTSLLSPQPLYDLLKGFETDLLFPKEPFSPTSKFPIQTERDLELYAERVAGTVAELCLELVFHHSPQRGLITEEEKKSLVAAGGRMGIALQYVNIARDIRVDAKIGRVYIPEIWLKEEGMTSELLLALMRQRMDSGVEGALGQVVGKNMEVVERLMSKLLDKAFEIYEEARPALDRLPKEAGKPMTVAVESYMEIGRVLRVQGTKGFQTGKGRATVPKMRRLGVAWKVLNGWSI